MESTVMRVSIIIPTLNEALILQETLDKISRLDPHEIIALLRCMPFLLGGLPGLVG